MQQIYHKTKSGFTLIQLSIMLTIASLVMVANLPGVQTTLNADKITVKKMNAIMVALRQYQTANSTLPCPADSALLTTSGNFGVAASNPGTTNNCQGGGTINAPYIFTTSSNDVAMGMVPVATLGLSSDYALDGYGRYITYYVDTGATAPCWSTTSLQGAITVVDGSNTEYSVMALVSHGADGHGAWLPAVTGGTLNRLNVGSGNANEQANAQVNGSFVTTGGGAFASLQRQTLTPGTFDDWVIYKNSQWNINRLSQSYASTTSYVANCTATCPYHRAITIDHTKVPNTDQTNFPMLFSGTYSYLATQANSGKITSNSGYDITFTSDAAGTVLLKYEQESYTTSGVVNYWVQVPTVSHTADTVIYLQYCTTVKTDQSNKNLTWDNSNYKAVWHLDENCGSSNCIKDSTSNVNSASPYTDYTGYPPGVIGNIYTASGEVNAAQTFDGAGHSVTAPDSASMDTAGSNTLTLSAWIKRGNSTAGGDIIVHGTGGVGGYVLGLGVVPCSADQVKLTKYGVVDICIGSVPEDTNWHYIVGVGDGTSVRAYVDGALSGTYSNTSNYIGIAHVFNIGNGNDQYYNGTLDEVRVSIVTRSADWITTEYNNQNSPGTFYTMGSEVAAR